MTFLAFTGTKTVLLPSTFQEREKRSWDIRLERSPRTFSFFHTSRYNLTTPYTTLLLDESRIHFSGETSTGGPSARFVCTNPNTRTAVDDSHLELKTTTNNEENFK